MELYGLAVLAPFQRTEGNRHPFSVHLKLEAIGQGRQVLQSLLVHRFGEGDGQHIGFHLLEGLRLQEGSRNHGRHTVVHGAIVGFHLGGAVRLDHGLCDLGKAVLEAIHIDAGSIHIGEHPLHVELGGIHRNGEY